MCTRHKCCTCSVTAAYFRCGADTRLWPEIPGTCAMKQHQAPRAARQIDCCSRGSRHSQAALHNTCESQGRGGMLRGGGTLEVVVVVVVGGLEGYCESWGRLMLLALPFRILLRDHRRIIVVVCEEKSEDVFKHTHSFSLTHTHSVSSNHTHSYIYTHAATLTHSLPHTHTRALLVVSYLLTLCTLPLAHLHINLHPVGCACS